jgi:ribosome biogenesis GTPase / thiamine phosphate phosphatase
VYQDRFEHSNCITDNQVEGWVIQKSSAAVIVGVGGERRVCTLAGRLRAEETAPAVGDRVLVTRAGEAGGRIEQVLPRRNRISRRAAGREPREQVMAANVDQVLVVVAAAEPAPRWPMVDRYLALSAAAGVPALICINKIDLTGEQPALQEASVYARLGYSVVPVAAANGSGMDGLRAVLAAKTTVLLGPSGVGKSTLVNGLCDADRRTSGISARSGKGRHTTSEAEAISLAGGGWLIDTPGSRELGLWLDEGVEVASLFVEMAPLLGGCRFTGCTHSHEIGCAIKQAVERGEIDSRRYHSFLRMSGRQAEAAGASPRRDERPGEAVSEGFRCVNCGGQVSGDAAGTTHRNHCPSCLWSRHLDVRPGDRAAACGGAMQPIAVWVKSDGEWALVHRCEQCGSVRTNRVAGDDSELALMSLAVRALARPPFPLERLGADMRAVR